MKILVTGGAGYIGSVMVRMLLEKEHDVLVVDDLSRGHFEALGGAELLQADIGGAEVRDACSGFKPEACMHFAARSLVGESTADPLGYMTVNVAGGLNLLRGLVESGCRYFVFSSSAATYGVPDTVPITEDVPAEPVNPYGLSKVMFEQILGELRGVRALKSVALRYFNAAGADTQHDLGEDHEPETHLIPCVIRAALDGTPVHVFGTDYPTADGTCVRDYIHVVDLCRAHLLALDSMAEGSCNPVYNLGNGNGFSVMEVVETVRRVSGLDLSISEEGRRPGDPPSLVASSDLAGRDLGWGPEFTDLDSIVRTAWQWHNDHPNGYGGLASPA